jgi:MFS family permease
MILPLFARRFGEIGAGVGQLGTSMMAGALTGALAAPFLGALADRFGRRRMILFSLAAYSLVFVGYLLAASAPAFILLRALAGALTAGLAPAVIAIVADLSPLNRRAQWVGIVGGGASFGWMAGPILGGVFYDRWGYHAAVGAAIVMAIGTFLIAYGVAPGTRLALRGPERTPAANPVAGQVGAQARPDQKLAWRNFRAALPATPAAFFQALWISFAAMFAWALIEPSFMFYAYQELGWTSTFLGLVMSVYGIAMMLGEFGLSRLSDRFGRKPVILLGIGLFAAQFIGLAFFRNGAWIAASFILAGLGNALFDPALSATLMDMTAAQHQARVQGVKSMASSLGAILGPGLAVALTPYLDAQAVFLVAVGIVALVLLTTAITPAVQPAGRYNHRSEN